MGNYPKSPFSPRGCRKIRNACCPISSNSGGRIANEQNQWITQLQLEPHVEGGYFRRTYQSGYTHEAIPYATTPRYLMTSIFYMLTDESPINYGSLWIPDWLGYFAQICLLSKPEGRRITCCYR